MIEVFSLQPKYQRVLLKLSGESLAGAQPGGIDFDVVQKICEPIRACVDMGVQLGVVVGGGNFWRGRSSGEISTTTASEITIVIPICFIEYPWLIGYLACPAGTKSAVPRAKSMCDNCR